MKLLIASCPSLDITRSLSSSLLLLNSHSFFSCPPSLFICGCTNAFSLACSSLKVPNSLKPQNPVTQIVLLMYFSSTLLLWVEHIQQVSPYSC